MKNVKYLLETIQHLRKKFYNDNYIDGFSFSLAMQNLLISEHGYVIDTGNYENVNREVLERLLRNIEKHPLIWSIFFMVA